MLASIIDISERKQAELQAQQQRDELEQLRQQRTALLEREVAERARLEREVIDICAREQRRIAYDLHDSVGQQLVGIALCAKLLEEQLRGERHSEADKAGMIVKLVNDAARQARLTARTLEGADGVGDLKTALQSLAISVSRDCSVKPRLRRKVHRYRSARRWRLNFIGLLRKQCTTRWSTVRLARCKSISLSIMRSWC